MKATTLFCSLLLSLFVTTAQARPALTATEARQLATEAYLYLYPLVTMEISRLQLTNAAPGQIPGHGPANTFNHMREYPTADFRAVVRPNFDTLYSSAWLDLTKEPVLISMPATNGRYYLLPMLDMWTDVLGAPGSRTTGTDAQVIAVVPPGWNGRLPKVVTSRLQATTNYLWLIGRIQTQGAPDYPAVHKIQDSMKITPLSQWGKRPVPPTVKIDPSIDMKTPVLEQVNTMTAEKFFASGDRLLKTNRPHDTDWSQIQRLSRLGLTGQGLFDASKLPADVRQALAEGAADGLRLMKEKIPTLAAVVNGWSMNTTGMGVYGNDYLKRAIVSMVGLGANQPEDAVYPLLLADKNGDPLTANRNYVIHFEKKDLPPNSAFWSITMYDEQGFQIANPLNRFAIGSLEPLKYNADGSLDLYFQHASPGADKESNWLPAPATGSINLTMRIYAPQLSVIDGRWSPPPVLRK